MRVFRSVAAVAVAAVAVLGPTACSGDKNDPKLSPTDAATTSPTTTASSTTSSSTTSGTLAGKDDYASWLAAVKGAKTHKLTMTTQLTTGSGRSVQVVGAVDEGSGDEPRIAVETKTDGETVKYILVGTKIYVNDPRFTDNKYGVVDTSDEYFHYAEFMRDIDLSAKLSHYADAVLSVEKKGDPVMIDGVSAQPYEVVVDESKVGAGDTDGEATAQSRGATTSVRTYYIGPDNLPRRLTLTNSQFTATTDYTDWGENVSIAAPSASEITQADPFGRDLDQ